ncbi:hypothetical protein IGA88_33410 [Pseudomonas aeruginosa]|uniref:hypothetical protein n=2 Tax=Pseudomonas TaxID=286 RepID=UPI002238E673|nr:hypothetical protein [Pseudomonas aeruginosa]MCW5276269.1 hypothetical protein [Pseudomonas aeruginosa]
MSLLSLNQTEKIDHEVQASACRIESLSEQWLTFQMNEFSPYLGMTPAGLACAVIEGSKQLIPHQQELTKIDLRILEVAFVMPESPLVS